MPRLLASAPETSRLSDLNVPWNNFPFPNKIFCALKLEHFNTLEFPFFEKAEDIITPVNNQIAWARTVCEKDSPLEETELQARISLF